MHDDPIAGVLVAVWIVVLILFLHDTASEPLPGCPTGMVTREHSATRTVCIRRDVPHAVCFNPSARHLIPCEASRRVPCGTARPINDLYSGPLALSYEDMAVAMADRCDRKKFPYCHALPIPFNKQLDSDYWENWRELGCYRDLVPDYPEVCEPIHGPEFMCRPSPLAPVRVP